MLRRIRLNLSFSEAMMGKTKIEWTERTWNPVRGCTRISEGCRHCYAESMAARFSGPGLPFCGFAVRTNTGPRWTGRVELLADKLVEPLSWRKPQVVFVNSMSDLFHEDLDVESIREVFEVMRRASRHRFQVLTKRSTRLRELSPLLPWRDNVWMGVSVENGDAAGRVDDLRQTGARIKFLSLEPLLGPLPHLNLSGIHWVIVGGESGPGARPMELSWVRQLRAQCSRAGVAMFVKQLGTAWARRRGARNVKGGDPLEWPLDLQVQEMPQGTKCQTR